MHTVSILGSCVSRDIFNRNFIPDYKDYFELKSYAHQPSMISIMSRCIPYHCETMVGTSASVLDKGQFEDELEKNFLRTLRINSPDVVILDFYGDVMYGAVRASGSYILGKDFRFRHYKTWQELDIGKRYYPRENFDQFFSLWTKKTDRFFSYMKEHLPDTQIVLNGAKAGKYYLGAQGEKQLLDVPQDVDQINDIWHKLDQYVLDHYDVGYLDFSQEEYYLNPDHVFGSYIVHFEQKYYDLYFKKLKALVRNQHSGAIYRNKNLLLNSGFSYGRAFWSHWDPHAQLDETEKKLIFSETGNENRVKRQCWSCAALINGDGKTPYKLKIRIKFHDLDDDGKFFCVRTFEKKDDYKYSKCTASYDFYADRYQLLPDQEQIFEYTLYPKGKYIKVAPFLNKNGYIEYSQISLRRV